MIDFGASLWLWLLPPVWGAALVLHLYFRRKRQVVPFSDVGFFLRDEHHPAMRRKLRDWLKLLVRLLILTLPVLAMAQPRLTEMKLAAGDEPRRVIVLDDSFSMERKLPAGESAFDAARRLALSLADSFDDGETALVFTSDVPGVLPTRDRDKLREAIRAAKLRPRAATLGTALAGAAEQAGVTEIFLISDFQQSMLGKWEERRGLRIYALALRGRDDNLAVEVSGGAVLPPRAGVEQQLRVKAVNYSGRPAESRLEFRYGGRKAGERLLNLSPGESRELEFSFTPAPGLTSGSVTVEDGNVTQDNRAGFTFRAEAPLKIGLVRGEGQGADPFYFLRYALDPGNDGGRGVTLETLGTAELSSDRLREFGLVVVSGGAAHPALDAYVRGGGRLWQLPASAAKSAGNGKNAKFAGALAELNDVLQLDLVEWRSPAELVPLPGDAVLLALADGRPLLLERRDGEGRRYLGAFGLRNRSSNWPLLRSFPVAMAKLTDYMASGGAKPGLDKGAPVGAESNLASASGAELRRRLPGVRELQPGGDWKLELDELRRGSALAGWLLLAALLLWGVDSYLGKEAAR